MAATAISRHTSINLLAGKGAKGAQSSFYSLTLKGSKLQPFYFSTAYLALCLQYSANSFLLKFRLGGDESKRAEPTPECWCKGVGEVLVPFCDLTKC